MIYLVIGELAIIFLLGFIIAQNNSSRHSRIVEIQVAMIGGNKEDIKKRVLDKVSKNIRIIEDHDVLIGSVKIIKEDYV